MRFGARMRAVIGPCTAGTGPVTSTRAPQPGHTCDDASRPAAAVVVSDARVPHWLTRPLSSLRNPIGKG